MGQPGTFSSGMGGMLGPVTYLTAKQGDGLTGANPQIRAVRMSHLEKAFIALRRRSASSGLGLVPSLRSKMTFSTIIVMSGRLRWPSERSHKRMKMLWVSSR